MSYDIDNRLSDSSLPSDVTLRSPLYRRQGIVASLLMALAVMSANRQLRRATRGYKSGRAPMIPDYLREDIGLTPLPPPIVQWWEVKW
jgi:hypothetical protein